MRSSVVWLIWLTMMCLATAAQSPISANDETGQLFLKNYEALNTGSIFDGLVQ
jgi:hypothetical protein